MLNLLIINVNYNTPQNRVIGTITHVTLKYHKRCTTIWWLGLVETKNKEG